ncbi:BON domain-containing protein [Paraburkholderia mimosarum]|uniref:BON domain-containing protein n=1 Tax=Paraburkholderia mimosarum TaxID=312026 RepID=UPI0039C11DAB
MKTSKAAGLVIATFVAVVSQSAWSQTQQAASAAAVEQGAPEGAESSAAIPSGRKADRALRRKVYAALGKDKAINAGNISVIAKNGAVTLSGTASDMAQIAKVEEIARAVPGVTSVTSKLTVKKSFGGM